MAWLLACLSATSQSLNSNKLCKTFHVRVKAFRCKNIEGLHTKMKREREKMLKAMQNQRKSSEKCIFWVYYCCWCCCVVGYFLLFFSISLFQFIVVQAGELNIYVMANCSNKITMSYYNGRCRIRHRSKYTPNCFGFDDWFVSKAVNFKRNTLHQAPGTIFNNRAEHLWSACNRTL